MAGLVFRTALWAFALLVGSLTGASFVKSVGGIGPGSGSTALLVIAGGLALAGFVVACVIGAMERVFPVFRASWGRR